MWITQMVGDIALKLVHAKYLAKPQRRCKMIWITAIGDVCPHLIIGIKM